MAVKAGGDNPETNRALAAVMREANALDVPRDVVERNIKKAMDPVTAEYKELTYEAYGYGGVGMIINCLSDNNNRATAEVSNVINKSGCKVASSGSVSFNFARRGRLRLASTIDEEQLIDVAIEAGCAAPRAAAPRRAPRVTATCHGLERSLRYVAGVTATSSCRSPTPTGAATTRRWRASC